MHKVSREQFGKIVERGIEAIPRRFLDKLDNVDFVVEDEPTEAQRKEMDLEGDETLFGLYEGVSQAERGDHYYGVLPDKITIFQNPIEEEAENLEDLEGIVRDTVWHEVAHHFGLDEEEVERAERKKKGK